MGYCTPYIAATHHTGCECWESARDANIARLTRERDEALAEVERLKSALALGCENTPWRGCECPGCCLAREESLRG